MWVLATSDLPGSAFHAMLEERQMRRETVAPWVSSFMEKRVLAGKMWGQPGDTQDEEILSVFFRSTQVIPLCWWAKSSKYSQLQTCWGPTLQNEFESTVDFSFDPSYRQGKD